MLRAGQGQRRARPESLLAAHTRRPWPRAAGAPEEDRDVPASVLGTPALTAQAALAAVPVWKDRPRRVRTGGSATAHFSSRPGSRCPEHGEGPCTRSTCALVQMHTRAGAGRPVLMTAPVPPPGSHMENLGCWPRGARPGPSGAGFHLSCWRRCSPGGLAASLRAFLASRLWLLLPWQGEGPGEGCHHPSSPRGCLPCVHACGVHRAPASGPEGHGQGH